MDAVLSIERSLDNLEEVLAPLLDEDLSHALTQLDLLQQAKLQVLLPYVINDLVFIYLKTRGINPKTHPVVGELDRLKQYFDKIKKTGDPEKRRFAVDQGAATRFIKHAIKESQEAQAQSQREVKQSTHTQSTDTVIVGSSASAAAIAKIQARNAENPEGESSGEESVLEVFEDGSKPENVVGQEPEGKEKEGVEIVEMPTSKKRRRVMDPWAGFEEPGTKSASPNAEGSEKRQQKKARRSSTQDDSNLAQEDIQVQGTSTMEQGKKAKKKNKLKPTNVVDIGALPEPARIPTPAVAQPSEAINVDALDSSQSDTRVQGESKKRKKKRQKQSISAISID